VASRGWTCRHCHHLNLPAHRKCRGEGCGKPKPKRRVPVHARVLRDTSYDEAARLSQLIHGGDLEACGVCGRPRGESKRHDRDHDHRTGKLRGLACFNCNRELLRGHTEETLQACLDYLRRAKGAV